MTDFNAFLPGLSIVITICVAVGVVIAFLGNKNRGLSEVQTSTITALQAQNAAQDQQIKALEKKIAHLNRVMLTVEYALKRRGLRIEIDDEAITLVDEHTKSHQTMQIRVMDNAIPENDNKGV